VEEGAHFLAARKQRDRGKGGERDLSFIGMAHLDKLLNPSEFCFLKLKLKLKIQFSS
jgi:hypothetical protein